jgi:hypothetical protein
MNKILFKPIMINRGLYSQSIVHAKAKHWCDKTLHLNTWFDIRVRMRSFIAIREWALELIF